MLGYPVEVVDKFGIRYFVYLDENDKIVGCHGVALTSERIAYVQSVIDFIMDDSECDESEWLDAYSDNCL